MNKTILFGMPSFAGMYKLIEKNLQYYGFNVINIVEDFDNWKPSLSERIYGRWRKIRYRDNNYKNKLKAKRLGCLANERIQGIDWDYALFINGHIYGQDFLKFIRKESSHGIVNYQFDGLHRFSEIYSVINIFDRFYVFDPNDLEFPSLNILPATNFYFDYDLSDNYETERDFYFVGAHMSSRVGVINNFLRYVKENKYMADIHVCGKGVEKRTCYFDGVNLHNEFVSFEENLKRSRQSRVLVDFVIDEHSGLSFRTFEALGYRKKLITTNVKVLNYDFYHPNNILVWDGEDFSKLNDFLELPYYEIDIGIRQKYSFGNWIKYILNIQPHQKISLPQ